MPSFLRNATRIKCWEQNLIRVAPYYRNTLETVFQKALGGFELLIINFVLIGIL